jgi:hypothetical protein
MHWLYVDNETDFGLYTMLKAKLATIEMDKKDVL